MRIWFPAGGLLCLVSLLIGCGERGLPALKSPPELPTAPASQRSTPGQTAARTGDEAEPGAPAELAGADRTPQVEPEPVAAVSPPATEPPRGDDKKVLNITFDTIKFDMKKGDEFQRDMLTTEIEQLKGRRVRIRGYMLPSFQQSGIKEFVLVRDNMECCFGPGAMIYDCVIVKMEQGASAEFDVKPIAVEGVFDIEELRLDGMLLGLYHLKANSAK